jgi:hypothetical protein
MRLYSAINIFAYESSLFLLHQEERAVTTSNWWMAKSDFVMKPSIIDFAAQKFNLLLYFSESCLIMRKGNSYSQ